MSITAAVAPPRESAAGWHSRSVAEVAKALGTDVTAGLTTDDAAMRLRRDGPNALGEAREQSLIGLVLGQLASPLMYLLLGAAMIALALGHRSDAMVIACVVVINAAIGAFQEGRAARSLRALRALSNTTARVVRGGDQLIVPARDLVVGDLLVVEAGDAVAADARVVESASLQVAEAALTGESLPVAKHADRIAADTALADRGNMLYSATQITAGRGHAIVVATAADAEIGRIASLAEQTRKPKTPLERRIAQFGRYVIVGALATFALIIGVGLLRGMPVGDIVMVGISQLVGMIPEGLPVAMTIALAVGVQRMAKRGAIVRQLAAVETLGSTTVICTDKTGTLTRNELTVVAIALPDGRQLAVTGTGYQPTGTVEDAGSIRELLEACALCNDARLDERDGTWTHVGDPTEVALLALAIKGGVDPAEVRQRFPRRSEQPFDPTTKRMATEHVRDGAPFVVIKGAPEVVVELGPESARADLLAAAARLADRALRVLAIAVVDNATLDQPGRVRILGLVGQIDPPRPEVADAVARCRAAGVRTVMVTGDHVGTGIAIARSLGIATDDRGACDGRELDRIDDRELAAKIDSISVFARVAPSQKLRIVGALQARGEVVAMTGDGVNDAPALVKADVGVAMGRTGTEVAKEASKVVVGDDNFATIVSAVEEGRIVYRNLKKAILLLFSTSAAEVLVLVLAMFLGYPAPFAAVQILWNNLLTEGLVTVNLVLEPAEGSEMQRPPIPRDEPLLDRILVRRFVVMAATITLVTLGWFVARTTAGVPTAQVQTETFTLLALCEWFNVLNCRSETTSALTWKVLRNHWLVGGLVIGNLLQVAAVFWSPLGSVLHTVPFDLSIVLALGVVGSLVLWVEEARKLAVRRLSRRIAAAAG